MPHQRSRPAVRWHTILIVVLTAGLLAVFLRNVDRQKAWDAIVQANKGWILAATLVTLQTYLLRAWRWQALLRPLGGAPFRTAFRTTVIGFAASFLLPGRVGEVLRPYLLARREGLNAASTFATVIVERLLDLCTVLSLFALALVTVDVNVGQEVRVAGELAAVASLGGLVTLFVLAGHPERLGRWATSLARHLPARAAGALGQFVRTFAEGLQVMRSPGHLAVAMLWSVPLWLSIALGILFTSWAFGVTITLVGSFIVAGYLVVGVAVPTPGAVGGFHVMSAMALTQFFAAPTDVAKSTAIILHLVSFIPVTLLGLLYMWQDGLTLGGLKGMKAEAVESERPDP